MAEEAVVVSIPALLDYQLVIDLKESRAYWRRNAYEPRSENGSSGLPSTAGSVWLQLYDPVRRRFYYYNPATNHFEWDFPKAWMSQYHRRGLSDCGLWLVRVIPKYISNVTPPSYQGSLEDLEELKRQRLLGSGQPGSQSGRIVTGMNSPQNAPTTNLDDIVEPQMTSGDGLEDAGVIRKSKSSERMLLRSKSMRSGSSMESLGKAGSEGDVLAKDATSVNIFTERVELKAGSNPESEFSDISALEMTPIEARLKAQQRISLLKEEMNPAMTLFTFGPGMLKPPSLGEISEGESADGSSTGDSLSPM